MPNTNSSHVVAIILAGGAGQRFGQPIPKQFIEIGGKSILHHTLEAFEGMVDNVVVVCQDEWREYVGNFPTATGGATGFESLCSGIEALCNYADDTLVVVHDAVRPLVTAEVILQNIAVARKYGNAVAAVEVYETLFSAPEGDGTVRAMTRREGIFRAQTPQTFALGTLRKMIEEARRRCIVDAQSACVLAQQLGYELHLSPGDLRNFKITTPQDLSLYEALSS